MAIAAPPGGIEREKSLCMLSNKLTSPRAGRREHVRAQGLLAGLALLGCAPEQGATQPRATAPVVAEPVEAPAKARNANADLPTATAKQPPAVAGDAGTEVTDAAPASARPLEPDGLLVRVGSDAAEPLPEAVLAEWLGSHGLDAGAPLCSLSGSFPKQGQQCSCSHLTRVGKPERDAVICNTLVTEGEWELVTSVHVLVPHGGRLKPVFAARQAVGALTKVDESEGPWVDLVLSFSDGGRRLALLDNPAPGRSCEESRRKRAEYERRLVANGDDPKEAAKIFAVFERATGRVCRERGSYVWLGDRFARERQRSQPGRSNTSGP
jgi:hypothetical protein